MRPAVAFFAAPAVVAVVALVVGAIWTLTVDRSVANYPILLYVLVVSVVALLGGLLIGAPVLALVSRLTRPRLVHALAIGVFTALSTQVGVDALLKPRVVGILSNWNVSLTDMWFATVLGLIYGFVFWWLSLRRGA